MGGGDSVDVVLIRFVWVYVGVVLVWFGWVVTDLVSKHFVNGSFNEGLVLLSGGNAGLWRLFYCGDGVLVGVISFRSNIYTGPCSSSLTFVCAFWVV